ncbi:uncharacterized protein PFL1_04500 [Pseudozyma flocculosa PF-1]|uniref:DUF938 domain-containing protein n=2 Tax=Pseudozyma flocculosa TaxID=84751 RepID=A0A5C3FE55_9BASI|nr:uncharacterized protein PFL1_04500 [Pseudozyma flocculosa PF-1]EPQ28173.1 hypothetical protein PFL1_04500 [Pseudozyma flocculosa PF-1]SPO41975.1 uncharacterized protein PSFLO_07458 [Pseudozyma flocculosa]
MPTAAAATAATATPTPPPQEDEGKYRSSWSVAGSAERNSGPIAETLAPLLPAPPAGSAGQHEQRRRPLVLELSSGFGHQISTLASRATHVDFQPTEADAYLCSRIDSTCSASPNVKRAQVLDVLEQQAWLGLMHAVPSLSQESHGHDDDGDGAFDAVVVCNLTHVAPWSVTESLFAHLDPRLTYLTESGQKPILRRRGWIAIYGAFNEHGGFTSDGNRQFDDTIKARNPHFGLRDVQGELVPLAQRHGFELQQRIEMPAGNLMLIFGLAQPQ